MKNDHSKYEANIQAALEIKYQRQNTDKEKHKHINHQNPDNLQSLATSQLTNRPSIQIYPLDKFLDSI